MQARQTFTLRQAIVFGLVFVLLYAALVWRAERGVRAMAPETALQRLAAFDGGQVDWLVLGASHALPFAFGDLPGRVAEDAGLSMLVLAEVGTGPVYADLILQRALETLDVRRVLYVADSFALTSRDWNEARLSDRKLLARTPLDPVTARLLTRRTLAGDMPLTALADYLTGFSKLNPVERFPQVGWQGAADFDQTQRPSRHAVAARIGFLYPETPPDPDTIRRYLDAMSQLIHRARASGADVHVLKPPLPPAFADALPAEAEIHALLAGVLNQKGIALIDASGDVPEPGHYFDTDHLNRAGLDAFYDARLRDLLLASDRPGS
ncbi:hypothetical protein ILP92_13195 [Maribius pontilimi]|uniref:Uncharacterized protein n=1 Tax=Palleronia pontilimi TaxID=1964209 RepID=A0A934IIL2_9RHOB|nr:hypothetical protein [Palleronia pontilimi]MBJ3763707.1 hypothetical protein [Palleronia pontilimi]